MAKKKISTAIKEEKAKLADKKITKKAKELEEIAKDVTTRGEFAGFVNFLKTQNIVSLAIGLAVGAAAGDTVRKFVEGFVNPLVQFIAGSHESLASATWTFKMFGRSAEFQWGAFVSSLFTLIVTAAVIYFFLRITGFYKSPEEELKKKK